MVATRISTLTCGAFSFSENPINTSRQSSLQKQKLCKPIWSSSSMSLTNLRFPSPCVLFPNGCRLKTSTRVSSRSLSAMPVTVNDYEFVDSSSEVELRLQLRGRNIQSSRDIFVDAHGTSLTIKVVDSVTGSLTTLMETNHLFDKIQPAETIWYIDDDQLVVNLKKQDPQLKWPDISESWESLTVGFMQLLKGTSIYLVGDSTEINHTVAQQLAAGLGYTPLSTTELLETFSKQTIDSWLLTEGSDSVAEGESAILQSLSSHARAVVATLGGQHGAAGRGNNWRHLYAGFTVWLSQTEASDEVSAKEEAMDHIKDGRVAYSNADVVVKLQGWDKDHVKSVAQGCLSALKQLILSDKKLPGKKSLYIRLGCRGDWPNITGWDPSAGDRCSISSPGLQH